MLSARDIYAYLTSICERWKVALKLMPHCPILDVYSYLETLNGQFYDFNIVFFLNLKENIYFEANLNVLLLFHELCWKKNNTALFKNELWHLILSREFIATLQLYEIAILFNLVTRSYNTAKKVYSICYKSIIIIVGLLNNMILIRSAFDRTDILPF